MGKKAIFPILLIKKKFRFRLLNKIIDTYNTKRTLVHLDRTFSYHEKSSGFNSRMYNHQVSILRGVWALVRPDCIE